mgnify:CR=1 FL=1
MGDGVEIIWRGNDEWELGRYREALTLIVEKSGPVDYAKSDVRGVRNKVNRLVNP